MRLFWLSLFCFLTVSASHSFSAEVDPPRILLVVAHPDDEYYFSAAVYRLVHEKHAVVDQLVITGGEMGFRYSTPSEEIYHLKLTDPQVAKESLAEIRKKELDASDSILGIRNHVMLGEKDFGYTQDVKEAQKHWNIERDVVSIFQTLEKQKYGFIFTLLPIASGHGHHQETTLMLLQAVQRLKESDRPVVLGATIDITGEVKPDADHLQEINEGKAYQNMKNEPIADILPSAPVFSVDRNQKFGFKNKLSYQIIVNWVIACHKTQGMFQTFTGRDDFERFKIFKISGPQAIKNTTNLFTW